MAQWVDAVIAVSLLEAAALFGWHHLTGAGVAPREWLANLMSGLCLMLALHGAVRERGPLWIAAFLMAAGICHAADLRRRWVRRTGRSTSRRGIAPPSA